MVGVASGTYASIFIAAPILTEWKEREPVYRRRRQIVMEDHGGVVPAFAETSLGDSEAASSRGAVAPSPRAGKKVGKRAPEGTRTRLGRAATAGSASTATAPPPEPEPSPEIPEDDPSAGGNGADKSSKPGGKRRNRRHGRR
jgi:SecD/SecF fusion protein